MTLTVILIQRLAFLNPCFSREQATARHTKAAVNALKGWVDSASDVRTRDQNEERSQELTSKNEREQMAQGECRHQWGQILTILIPDYTSTFK